MSLGFLGTDQGFEDLTDTDLHSSTSGVNTSKSSSRPAFFLLTTTHSYEMDYTWGSKGDVLTSAHKEKMPLCTNLLISNVITITSGFKLNSSLASIMSGTMKTQAGLLPYFPKNASFECLQSSIVS